jgi:PAS domain S-box-containing protein
MTKTTFADYVADNIPVMCWMADADGGIHWYNQAWYDYTGTTPEQMDGWGWRKCHDPEILPAVLIQWMNFLAAKKPFQMVFPLRGADGVYRIFLTRVRPTIRDGKVVSWFGSNTDVSDLIGESNDLKAQLDSLGHEGSVLSRTTHA